MIMHGLALVGNDERRQNRAQRLTRLHRFKRALGSSPTACSAMLVDLQKMNAENVKLKVREGDPRSALRAFLISLCFLRHCPAEEDEQGLLGLRCNATRPMKWRILGGIQHLKQKKIMWPAEWTSDPLPNGAPIFLISAGGGRALRNARATSRQVVEGPEMLQPQVP